MNPLRRMRILSHRYPLLCSLCLGLALFVFTATVYAQGESPFFGEAEKWVGRVVVYIGGAVILIGFVYYLVRGKSWDELNKALQLKDEYIATLTTDRAELTAENTQLEAKLHRSRILRLGQKKLIFRMAARLEGENKEFHDIIDEAELDEDFDLIIHQSSSNEKSSNRRRQQRK